MRIVLGILLGSAALLLALHSAGVAYNLITLPSRFHFTIAYKRDQAVDIAVSALGSLGCVIAARQCFTRRRREVPAAPG